VLALTPSPNVAALPPGFYYGTEIVYCILSLTSKLYLGWFLMSYVLWQDVDAEQSLGGSTA
jgi:hypothetical protein